MSIIKTGNAVVLLSGGQDSTTTLYWAYQQFENVKAIAFNYGQKHEIELSAAASIAYKTNTELQVIELPFMKKLSDSALLNHVKNVNDMNTKNLPDSFVPNRNQLFITIAHAYAQKIGYENIVIGACETDYSGYPDCRQAFISMMEEVTNLGSDSHIRIHAPLMYLSKAETWELADKLGVISVIAENTHTCYNGTRVRHEWGFGCGTCPACELRSKGYETYMRKKHAIK